MFSVTETTIKRWADEGALKCQKTPGGHRKFDVKAVVEFAEENKMVPSGTFSLGSGEEMGTTIEAAVLVRDFPLLANILMDKLLSSGSPNAHILLSYVYGHKVLLSEIYDHVVRPAMCQIGVRWATGEIGINHEHRASAEIMAALARLQADALIKSPNGKTVLLACVGEEQHEIGLRCASYLLEAEGWGINYYGARTPVHALVSAIAELRPSLVCVSISAYGRAEENENDLRALHDVVRSGNVSLVVGGSGASSDLLEKGVCDAVVTSSAQLLKLTAVPRTAPAGGHRES